MSEARLTAARKRQVAERAQSCCEYYWSQQRYSSDPFSIEHIIPRSLGGPNDPTYLALACQGCNGRKYASVTATDPVSGQEVALYHPRQDAWRDHFAWSADLGNIVPLTPTGRATLEKLQLNRPGVVNLRRALFLIGRHPPDQTTG